METDEIDTPTLSRINKFPSKKKLNRQAQTLANCVRNSKSGTSSQDEKKFGLMKDFIGDSKSFNDRDSSDNSIKRNNI